MGMRECVRHGWCFICFAASRGIVLNVVKDQEAGAIMKSFCRFVSMLSGWNCVRPCVVFHGRGNAKFHGKVWGWLTFEFDEGMADSLKDWLG